MFVKKRTQQFIQIFDKAILCKNLDKIRMKFENKQTKLFFKFILRLSSFFPDYANTIIF